MLKKHKKVDYLAGLMYNVDEIYLFLDIEITSIYKQERFGDLNVPIRFVGTCRNNCRGSTL